MDDLELIQELLDHHRQRVKSFIDTEEIVRKYPGYCSDIKKATVYWQQSRRKDELVVEALEAMQSWVRGFTETSTLEETIMSIYMALRKKSQPTVTRRQT